MGNPTKTLSWFQQPVNRRLLVKLDMPELQSDAVKERRRLEVYCENPTTEAPDHWRPGTLQGVTLDGRATIRWDDAPEAPVTLELASERFRWLVGGDASGWDAA